MSEHATPAVKSADDPAFKLPESLSALRLPLCFGGLAALVIGWGIGYRMVGERFGMSVYLTAFTYCLTITIGCLFFVLIQHLCRAGWSAIVRRVAELVMVMIIPLAILFIPILVSLIAGNGSLYSWDYEADSASYGSVHHISESVWSQKSRWLAPGWFTFRAVIYFAVWSFLAIYFFRASAEQDKTGDKSITERLQWWSGPAVMAFCLVTSLASFDWVMSLAPMWFSTMFGVYIFTGSVLSAHCLVAVGTYILQKRGAMRDEVTIEHYHDLGKYIFGFLLFWAYIGFSQMMLIWYANIPEETEWFYHRWQGIWLYISVGLIFFHWMLPFAATMSRQVRRRPGWVCFWAAYVLVLHFVDVYWLIMPEARGIEAGSAPAALGGFFGVTASVLCTAGMAALLVGLVLRVAEQHKVVAVHDPRLGESIAFENI